MFHVGQYSLTMLLPNKNQLIMKMTKTISILSTCLLMTGATQAAVISWEAAQSITSSSTEVVNTGTTVKAVNATSTQQVSANPTLDINGVTFTSSSVLGGNFNTPGWTPTADGDYDPFLDYVDFQNSGTGMFTFDTITVEDGKDYLVQFWYAAEGTTRAMTLDSFDGDGSGDVTLSGGQFVIGTFTADGTTQDLAIQASANGPRITGYQVRAVAVPEPSSSALLGLGLLAVTLRRKR